MALTQGVASSTGVITPSSVKLIKFSFQSRSQLKPGAPFYSLSPMADFQFDMLYSWEFTQFTTVEIRLGFCSHADFHVKMSIFHGG